MALDDLPTNLPITGIGFSDSDIYAQKLSRIFAYRNTYLHTQPELDVTNSASCECYLPVDFVVCTEVFEHIAPPVEKAFSNLRSLLRPGGLLVFSTPTLAEAETIEHFPNFHSAKVLELKGTHVLINRTQGGDVEVFQHLLFHGGPGTVLEMRVFSHERLLEHLAAASFTDINVYGEPIPEIGYYWGSFPHEVREFGNILGYVIAARAA